MVGFIFVVVVVHDGTVAAVGDGTRDFGGFFNELVLFLTMGVWFEFENGGRSQAAWVATAWCVFLGGSVCGFESADFVLQLVGCG